MPAPQARPCSALEESPIEMILGQKREHAVIVLPSSLNEKRADRLGPRDVVQVNCLADERSGLCESTNEAHALVLGRAIANMNDHQNLLN
jgi:hypothetical protein